MAPITVARMTKDRITNVLGVLGAIFCLVAVLTGFGHAPGSDNAPGAPPPTSQVGPAPQAPAGQPSTAPAAPSPAPKKDNDG